MCTYRVVLCTLWPANLTQAQTKRTSSQRHGDGHLRLGDRVHGAGEEGRLDGDLLGERAPELLLSDVVRFHGSNFNI